MGKFSLKIASKHPKWSMQLFALYCSEQDIIWIIHIDFYILICEYIFKIHYANCGFSEVMKFPAV